jgi:hypothetical protein
VASRQAVQTARRRPSAWGWLVTVSACLVAGTALTLTVWWLLSSQRTTATE